MGYEIETNSTSLYVTYPNSSVRSLRLDQAAKKLRGKLWNRDGFYSFPLAAEAEVRAIVDDLNAAIERGRQAAAATPTPTEEAPAAERPATPAGVTTGKTGWSNAARTRSGHGHPLGDLIERDGGRSIYRDHATGGRVEIWDNA